jgi:hypothetical protein
MTSRVTDTPAGRRRRAVVTTRAARCARAAGFGALMLTGGAAAAPPGAEPVDPGLHPLELTRAVVRSSGGLGSFAKRVRRLERRVARARQRRARISAVLREAVAGADRIAPMPYRWGGGHGSFADTGYDCSGSVSYVLHAAGRLAAPMSSIALMAYGEPGPGRFITIYSRPSHAFMVINGRRYDTSGQSQSGSRWQATARSTAGFVARHPPGL